MTTAAPLLQEVTVLRPVEEGSAPCRVAVAVGPNGGLTGGRRRPKAIPGRVAPSPSTVARAVPGLASHAATTIVAPKLQVGLASGRQVAGLATAGVVGLAASHPTQGLNARPAKSLEELPTTAGARPATAVAAVLPTPAAVAAVNPVAGASVLAGLASPATSPRAPTVRQVVPRNAASPARAARPVIPLDG